MAQLTPIQVVANALQIERIPGTDDNPFVNVDGAVLRGFAAHAIQMLRAYGYEIVDMKKLRGLTKASNDRHTAGWNDALAAVSMGNGD